MRSGNNQSTAYSYRRRDKQRKKLRDSRDVCSQCLTTAGPKWSGIYTRLFQSNMTTFEIDNESI